MSCIYVTLCRVRGFGRVWVGLGWVMGPSVHLAVGWVGLGQLFGGLGRVGSMKIDPRTTLQWTLPLSVTPADFCGLQQPHPHPE